MIVLCGISTSIGVDTTAREAYQHEYHHVFAEDAMPHPPRKIMSMCAVRFFTESGSYAPVNKSLT
nr:isochorismatase family protein [Paenibacillus sp. PSB04]